MLSERGGEETKTDLREVYFIGAVSLLCRYGRQRQRGLYSDEELEDCSCVRPLLFPEDKE